MKMSATAYSLSFVIKNQFAVECHFQRFYLLHKLYGMHKSCQKFDLSKKSNAIKLRDCEFSIELQEKEEEKKQKKEN